MKVRGLWGLEIEPSKTYEFSVDASFRISMASINSFNGPERTSVFIEFQNQKFTLCSLIPEKIEQQVIDITCLEGEKIFFGSSGPNCIHLTGNYVSPYNEDSEEEEEEEEAPEFDVYSIASKKADLGQTPYPSAVTAPHRYDDLSSLTKDDYEGPSATALNDHDNDVLMDVDEKDLIAEEDIKDEDEMFKMGVIFDYFDSINSQNKEPEELEEPEEPEEPQPETKLEPEYDLAENEKDETKSLVSLIKDEPEIIEIPSGQTSDVEFDSHEIHTETTDIETEPALDNNATNQEVEIKKKISDVKEPIKTESKNSNKKSTRKKPDTLNDNNSVVSNNSNTIDKSSKSSKKIEKKKKKKATEDASKKANNKSAASNNAGTLKKNKGSATPPIVSAIPQQVTKSKSKLSNNDHSKKAEPSTNSSTKSKKSKAKEAQPISIPTASLSPSNSNEKARKSSKKNTPISKAASNTPNAVSKKTPKTEKKIARDSDTSAGLQAEIEKSKVRAKEIDLILAKKFEDSKTESDINNLVSPNQHAQNSTKAEKNKDQALKRYPKRTRAPDFEKNLEMMAKGDALMAAYVSRSNLKKRKRSQKKSATNSPSVS